MTKRLFTEMTEAPEETRLFIGNLVPAISNVALQASLSKFGTVKELSRNLERNFAHASLMPVNAKDIDKCFSVLNQTRWFGTVLRVEVASEHFQARLSREWAEAAELERMQKLKALVARREQRKANEVPSGNSPSTIAHSFSWKGKRTKFFKSAGASRADISFLSKLQQNREPGATPSLDASHLKLSGSIPTRGTEAIQEEKRKVSKPVAATLDLFGLAVEEQHPVDCGNSEVAHQPISKKRTRASDAKNVAAERAAMRAIEDDPSKIDLDAEKDRALSIFEKMFSPGPSQMEANRLEKAVSLHRRKGLHRKLVQDRVEAGDEANVSHSVPCTPTIAGASENVHVAIEKCRRKGLYIELMTTQTRL